MSVSKYFNGYAPQLRGFEPMGTITLSHVDGIGPARDVPTFLENLLSDIRREIIDKEQELFASIIRQVEGREPEFPTDDGRFTKVSRIGEHNHFELLFDDVHIGHLEVNMGDANGQICFKFTPNNTSNG